MRPSPNPSPVPVLGCGLALALAASGWAAGAAPPRWIHPGPEPGLLWIDGHQGPGIGADNLLYFDAALGRLEDRLLPTRLFEEEGFLRTTASLGYRVGKLLFLDLPAVAWLPVMQHELFGHGWRARESGYGSIRYTFGAPPPYGRGGGSTSWTHPGGEEPSLDRRLAMDLAGIEATDIMARRQRARFLQSGYFGYRASLLYLNSSLGLITYAYASDEERFDGSNDVLSWIEDANRKNAGRRWVGLSDLEDGARWALADPFLWYSAWTLLRYLGSGAAHWIPPAVPLGPVRWLPALGYRLTPFGGQGLLENHFAWAGRAIALRLAAMDGELGAASGADLEAAGLLAWRGFNVDAELHLWNQPELGLGPRDPPPSRRGRPGGGFGVSVVLPALARALPLRLGMGASLKSAGYLPGERLDAGPTLRAGIGLYP